MFAQSLSCGLIRFLLVAKSATGQRREASRHVDRAQRLGPSNIVRTARRIHQHSGRGPGRVFSGDEGSSRFASRTAHHSIGLESLQKHVQIKRVSKYSMRDAGCRKVLLAQSVIAKIGVL